jgi:hypothetical protein
MMPDEVMRLDNRKCIVLLRGHKPLLLDKITPEEFPVQAELKYTKITDYSPEWRNKTPSVTPHSIMQDRPAATPPASGQNVKNPLPEIESSNSPIPNHPSWYTDKSYLGCLRAYPPTAHDTSKEAAPPIENPTYGKLETFETIEVNTIKNSGMIRPVDDGQAHAD